MSLDTIHNYIHEYGYLAVGLGTVIDQSGVAAFVVAGGAYAASTGNLNPVGVVAAGAIGSFCSDLILYGIGRWKATWLERWVKTDKAKMRMMVLRDGMYRWALPLVALGRFLPWIGRFVPAAAGLQRYPMAWAMLWAALGSIICGVFYTAVGYYAAASFSIFREYAALFWIGTLLISFPVSAWVMRRFDRIVDARLKAKDITDAKSKNVL